MSSTITPVNIAYLTESILDTMVKGGLNIKIRQIKGVNVVEGVHANSKKMRYLIGSYAVKGPDPDAHSEHNGFNAVVHNIDEDLSAAGLNYNKALKKYVGEFSIR